MASHWARPSLNTGKAPPLVRIPKVSCVSLGHSGLTPPPWTVHVISVLFHFLICKMGNVGEIASHLSSLKSVILCGGGQ